MSEVTNAPEPLDMTFHEHKPQAIVPLDFCDDGELPACNELLRVLRSHVEEDAESPWLWIDASGPAFRPLIAIWLAGLARLLVGTDATSKRQAIFARPVEIESRESDDDELDDNADV
jgi:hypothetical protein